MVCALVLAGCGIRKPETPCEWAVQDPSISLLDQIQRAEDIVIRHVDGSGSGGPGSIRRRETRARCEAHLFAAIANSRKISVDEVLVARRQLDRRGFDWLVNLPMAVFTFAVAVVMRRRVQTRFPDDPLPRVVAIALLSLGLSILVIGVGQVWAFAVEGIRIGHDHLSYRGLRIPWGKHRAETFTLAMLTMGLIAAIPAPRTHLRHPPHPGTNP
jgi:hypothetical protein